MKRIRINLNVRRLLEQAMRKRVHNNKKNKKKISTIGAFSSRRLEKESEAKKQNKTKITEKSQRKAPFRAGGRRAPLPWLMTHTITITGNHPSFHLYLKLFHIMSNQTKITTDALVTQWELGKKTPWFTIIHTESQSLPVIFISPLLLKKTSLALHRL